MRTRFPASRSTRTEHRRRRQRASGNHADVGVAPGLPDAVQCVGVVCATNGDPGTPTPEDLDGARDAAHLDATAMTGNQTAVFEFTADDGANGDPRDGDDLRVPPRRAAGPAGAAGGARARAAGPERATGLPEPPEGEYWVECVSP